MPTLNDVAAVRKRASVHEDIDSCRIEDALGQAERRLKRWIGREAYADAIAATTTTDEEILDRRKDLRQAELALAIYFGVASWNTTFGPNGQVVTATEEGERVITYLSPTQIETALETWLGLAKEMARPYLIDAPASGVEFVECVV